MNSLKIGLSKFEETYQIRMDYPSVRGGNIPDHYNKSTWNIFHGNIDSHSQILIAKYPGDG